MNKKQSIARIAAAVWVIGFVLTIFGISPLSVPPADLPLYIGLACITLVPLNLAHAATVYLAQLPWSVVAHGCFGMFGWHPY